MKVRAYMVTFADANGQLRNWEITVEAQDEWSAWSAAVEEARRLGGARPDQAPYSCVLRSAEVHSSIKA